MRLLLSIILACFSFIAFSQDTDKPLRNEIIYGHKDGLALSMVMLAPAKNANGKAIVNVISGNWISNYRQALAEEKWATIYLEKGYTVFNVMHGSQPRYNIQDAVTDLKRAVRFIRYNAASYKIDPAHIGITGSSSGGHLSLMIATTDTKIDTAAKDPIDKVSSRVQAIAIYFPPTDFLNYGEKGFNPSTSDDMLVQFGVAAAFDFKTWNEKQQKYVPAGAEERLSIARQLSPIYAVSSDDPPVFIVHGDKDDVVPLQQSETIIAAFKEAKVPAELVVKPGEGHGWKNSTPEELLFIKWFDKYLK